MQANAVLVSVWFWDISRILSAVVSVLYVTLVTVKSRPHHLTRIHVHCDRVSWYSVGQWYAEVHAGSSFRIIHKINAGFAYDYPPPLTGTIDLWRWQPTQLMYTSYHGILQ